MMKHDMKTADVVTKTATLYSAPLPDETMQFLRGLALDCSKVKNYVYSRYSGIKNVNRLSPVYSVLNEMRYCGLRQQLALPVVYYELAIAEAVSDIRGMWGILKNKIRDLIKENENLSPEDRLYIRTVLKMNSVFSAILNHQEYEMPDKAKGMDLDVKRLNNLICRLVRRHLKTPGQRKEDSFSVSPAGYRSDEKGLYLTGRIPRRRIFLPVSGIGKPDRQLRIIIRENDVRIAFPVDVEARKRKGHTNVVYAYIGYSDMLTLSGGNIYGKGLGSLVTPETERLADKNKERGRLYSLYGENDPEDGKRQDAFREKIEKNNLGKKKYNEQKRCAREKTTNYINAELNRMFREEKPAKIVITKPVMKNRAKSYSKIWNRKMSRSFQGYIREQLAFKCRLNMVELEQISAKGTGSVCSVCGKEGKRIGRDFLCEACGYQSTIALNSAGNIERIARSEEKKDNGKTV